MSANGFNPGDLYDQFPRDVDNDDDPPPPPSGWVWVNNRANFTTDALKDPLLQAFVNAPFAVSMGLFKSSTRESEWMIHEPHRVMAGEIEGVEGRVERFPDDPDKVQISTLVINHERTLAVRKLFAVVIEDGKQAGQLIYKQHQHPAEAQE
jgi:hypothetical protein